MATPFKKDVYQEQYFCIGSMADLPLSLDDIDRKLDANSQSKYRQQNIPI
jgi:hypothetical protein